MGRDGEDGNRVGGTGEGGGLGLGIICSVEVFRRLRDLFCFGSAGEKLTCRVCLLSQSLPLRFKFTWVGF
jgi:hypothetical protein